MSVRKPKNMNMTPDEYIKRVNENNEWAPGWEAIDNSFSELYPNQEPRHLAMDMASRAIFGGDQYLDGCSIYQSAKGYAHIVTYGLSELYANAEAFGGEYSRWGYEMTMKLPTNTDYMWAIDLLANLARYTFTQRQFFEPYQFISGGGNPIKADSASKLTALYTVQDTELKEVITLHGKLNFIQLVGITQHEFEKLMENPDLGKVLIEKMQVDNPMLVTDLARTNDYL